MSLNASLFGKDSDNYQHLSGVVDEVLKAVSRYNPRALSFSLGRLDGESLEADVGITELHSLRGYAAHIELEGEPPKTTLDGKGHYPTLKRIYDGTDSSKRFQHLINHSDCGGYYIPIEFAEPVLLERRSFTLGTDGPVGSSQKLLSELDEINKYLNVVGDYGQVERGSVEQTIRDDPWASEKHAWSVLHWLARESIARHLILIFA